MYIKKSVLSGVVIAVGTAVLLAIVVLYGFTEVGIPKMVYIVGWFTCVMAVKVVVGIVESNCE